MNRFSVNGIPVNGFSVPEFDLPESAVNFAKSLQDGAYVVIGLAVLAMQRAQVQRVELQKQVEAYLAELREQSGAPGAVGNLASTASSQLDVSLESARTHLLAALKGLDGQVRPARTSLEDQADRLEDVLPDQARDLLRTLREAARRREQGIRAVVGLDDAPGAPQGDAAPAEPSPDGGGDEPGGPESPDKPESPGKPETRGESGTPS
jgi:hypothetical protein